MAYEMCISDWSSDVCSSDLEKIECLKPELEALALFHRKLLEHADIPGLDGGLAQGVAADFAIFQVGEPEGAGVEAEGGVGVDRKSDEEGKSVSVRVDHGVRSIINKNSNKNFNEYVTI